MRSKSKHKARAEWLALNPGAHEGYVSWERAEAIRKMVSNNTPTSRRHGAPMQPVADDEFVTLHRRLDQTAPAIVMSVFKSSH